MKKLMWFIALIVATAGVGYAMGTVYISKNPNTDTTVPHGTYSEVLETSQQKDQKELQIFTVAGAAFGSLLGVIKIKSGHIG